MTTGTDYLDGLSKKVLDRLHKPLDSNHVLVNDFNTRKPDFEYISHETLIQQANSIFGHAGWGYEIVGDVTLSQSRDNKSFYQAKVRLEVRLEVDGTLVRMGVGAREVAGDSPSAHDTAMSSAVTLALKRAFKNFGPQFGLGLGIRGNRSTQGKNRQHYGGGRQHGGNRRQHDRSPTPQRSPQQPQRIRGVSNVSGDGPPPSDASETTQQPQSQAASSNHSPKINLPAVKKWMDSQGMSVADAITLMGIDEFSTRAVQGYMAQEGLSSAEALCARLDSQRPAATAARL